METKDKISNIANKKDIGKIMVIVSITVMVFSLYASYSLNMVSEDLESAEQDLENIRVVMSSESFQTEREALEDLGANGLSGQMSTMMEVLDDAESSVNKTGESLESVEQTKERYQWLFLLSVLSLVAGATTMQI